MTNTPQKKAVGRDKTVTLLAAVLAVLAVVMLLALCLRHPRKTFTPPPFEPNAVTGTPTVPDDLGYGAPYKPGMAYRFSVCGSVTAEGSEAVIYLTNPADNDVWLKLRVLDAEGNLLGETGLLRPGEYVRTVALTTVPAPGTPITLKIMGYQPTTYQSSGSATLTTTLAG